MMAYWTLGYVWLKTLRHKTTAANRAMLCCGIIACLEDPATYRPRFDFRRALIPVAALILIGVSGFHVLVASFPSLVNIARFGGAAFLFIYGLISFFNAARVQQGLQPSDIKSNSAWQSALTCLAFTWLNPHVYLDTVVLLGSVSTQFGAQVNWFAAGATSASFVFFFALGYGARLLRPLFAKARSWQILDILIGCIMWGIALRLVFMTGA